MESDRRSLDESLRGSLKDRDETAASVSLEAVAKTFGSRSALLPTTLNIQAGEFVSLLGPSGSGKSTLLRIIAGLVKADAGSRVSVGKGEKSFVFQDAALLPWRTVSQNISLPLEMRRRREDDRVKSALKSVGLAGSEDLYPNQLSGGMRMRVSVARALVSKPSLLLLDEPFAALDERTRFKLQEDLRSLWKTLGMTVIFVTHSVSEAVFVSDRAIVFSPSPGRVIADRRFQLGLRDGSLRRSQAYLDETETLNRAFDL